MTTTNDKNHIIDLMRKSQNIAIVCNSNGNDTVAAGIALAHFLIQNTGKTPSLIYKGELDKLNPELLELFSISNQFQPKALKITLDYAGTNIETVNYHKNNNDKLILEVKPVDGDFDMSRIKYDVEGLKYDLIITMGVEKLSILGNMYRKNQKDFDSAVIINIDTSGRNEVYGRINIVDSQTPSLSELIYKKFSQWDYIPTKKAAQSLLIGLAS